VQEEPHHVVLGEQLRDGWQLGGADLAAGGVNAFLLVGLPVLVDPPKGVV